MYITVVDVDGSVELFPIEEDTTIGALHLHISQRKNGFKLVSGCNDLVDMGACFSDLASDEVFIRPHEICDECDEYVKGMHPDVTERDEAIGYTIHRGHLECLKHLHNKGYPLPKDSMDLAVMYGQNDCLEYLYSETIKLPDPSMLLAAECGYLDCIKSLHEMGHKWSNEIGVVMAGNGDLDCIKYAIENGCPVDADTMMAAAKNYNIDCLKYLHDNGCQHDERIVSRTTRDDSSECVLYLVVSRY